jgi:hypothetical protein
MRNSLRTEIHSLQRSQPKHGFRNWIGWLALGFSAILWLLQRPLGISFRWPIAAFLEVYPYWLVIPFLGWLVLLKFPKTRWGWVPLAIATLFLVMNLAPIWQWWAGPPLQPSVGIETRSTPVPLRVMSYNLWIVNVCIGARIFGTWNYRPQSGASWLKVPIDHIFVRGLRLKKAWASSPGGSDHRPVVADLQLFG